MREHAIEVVKEDHLDLFEVLRVMRIVQQAYTDKDNIMDQDADDTPEDLIYSCLSLVPFGPPLRNRRKTQNYDSQLT